ncbi:MAG: TonB-dependent receptor [Dysgonamonadaceae bacterium]|nr:TonB-dependent receptor [Dysgonamonadaceae bacterium]MDD3899609.1 TonB-dependent receptor [Dysgonamonadaceae bacterium]MDD4398122.1 TonB-dependent receptor [Dysgonamonadaceae bacterium]MEA5081889.1 TonB-dependent receptor [Dysgonamonadaceae bacterium]
MSANENDSLRTFSLDSIVVTNIKQPYSKWLQPTSISSINSNVIELKQIREMKDFSAFIPNFIMIDRDSKLTSSVFIRGVGSIINAPGVAMYVDGVPHFEKSSFDINLMAIDKIEFLRGPQGTLYGRNAMGGIILVHSKSPFIHQGTKIQLRYGRFNDINFSVSHLNRLSNKFAYSISGEYEHSDGFIPNIYTKKNADKLNSTSINSRLEWRPTNKLSFRLINGFNLTNQGAFTYGLVDTTKNWVDSINIDHESSYKRKIYDSGLQINFRNNYIWLSSQSSIQLLNDNYTVDQDASPKNLYYAIQTEDQFLLAQEINIHSLNESWYEWNAGVFAFNHQIKRGTDVFINMVKPNYQLEKRYNDYNRGFALFHQSSFRLTPSLNLEAGIRYDYENANSVHIENKIIEGQKTLIGDYNSPLTFKQWTPKISAQYSLTNKTHIYATIAKGYKTGGFNTVFEKPEERTFQPEKSWNYEIGTKISLLQNKLNLETAFFYIDIKDQQVKQLIDLQGVKIYNAGKTVNKGIEFTLIAMPINNFNVNLSYGFTDAKFKEYIYSNKLDYSGNYLPFIPRNTLSAGGVYTINHHSILWDRLDIGANYIGMGKIYWHENNKINQPFYNLINASLTFYQNNMTLTFWGKNITNTKYLGYYFESAGKKLGKPGKPMSFGISASYRIK